MQGARLPRLGFGGAGASKRPAPTEAADQSVTERLPLLGELTARAATGGRCVVMDFGPASRASIALFNDLQCRVDIVNFPAALPQLGRARDVEDFRRRLDQILIHDPAHPASMVLCWDFLNYLPRGAISLLMDHVANRCAPGARVHALIAYSSTQMPAQPCRYTPSGREAVRVRPQIEKLRESPRYTPKDLERCMPAFAIDRAMMLRNGFQEYLLRLKAPELVTEPPDMRRSTTGESSPIV